MAVVTMKALLESGVHFGHQTRRWNPKMGEYIYTHRGGIHIIDLQRTSRCIDKAYDFMKSVSRDGGEILFIGTKKQAKEAVKEEAMRCGVNFVNVRWLGGTLTNFETIKKRVIRLKQLVSMREDGTFDLMPKKEVIRLNLQIQKLEKFLGGIKDMKGFPSVIFIIDPKKDQIAVLEAKKLKIPIIGVVDTNCDPTLVDYVIPANDDAIRSVKLMCSTMANAVIEGCEGNINNRYSLNENTVNNEDSEVSNESTFTEDTNNKEEFIKDEKSMN